MNEIIKIEARDISGAMVNTCNARDLWQFVESKRDFSTWIKSRIEKYGFVEGADYLLHKFVEQLPSGSKLKIDYHLTIDAGKELAMVENNEKGREVRRYFIECERKAKQSAIDPMKALSDPAAMRGLLLTYTEKVLTLESKVVELTPKAEALDRIATFGNGSYCIREAAKLLSVQEKRLRQKLQEIHWIYHPPIGGNWLGYAQAREKGYVEHKRIEGEKSDGSRWESVQVRITDKGLAKLATMIQAEAA